ncbi:hypothetical protein [Anabaena sp. UHCC 0399]|uniref:hypothetical protein n=1 Tax=Anabaena sp. UHCC 0399 TaxID=3110238 RepID=UPI002B21FBCE|nr:hypothetical protein [Anabaena sp. UHCC 0399]MEA5568208.1 hypothetical protein [Anabaena sp. UHCC 0399]
MRSQERFRIPQLLVAIGVDLGIYGGWEREWLFWFNQDGERFPSPDERVEQAQQAQQELEDLRNRLKQHGIDPDSF